MKLFRLVSRHGHAFPDLARAQRANDRGRSTDVIGIAMRQREDAKTRRAQGPNRRHGYATTRDRTMIPGAPPASTNIE